LPALDYLLHGDGLTDQQVLDLFTVPSAAANRRQYLSAVTGEIKTKTDNVRNGWISSGGNYISSFVSNTGSDVGGSIGILVNQLNYDFELTKNARMGIPLGKKSMGVALPEKSEALYGGYSISLALGHLRNVENIYLGRTASGINGIGFDDYLNHVGAQYAGGSLNDAIISRIASARTKLMAIPVPLSEAVLSHADMVDQAYADLQQLVVLLKVDMPSALGVLITYQDNDGD
jgi:predicted lipoprotein